MYVKNNFEVTLVAKLEQVEVGASHLAILKEFAKGFEQY